MNPVSKQEQEQEQEQEENNKKTKSKNKNKNKDSKLTMYDYINTIEKGSYSNQDLLNDFNHCLKQHDNIRILNIFIII